MSDSEADIIPIQTIKTVSKEVAEEQFDSFLDHYFLNLDDLEIENGPEAIKTVRNTVVRSIVAGLVSIETGQGLVVRQTLRDPFIGKENTVEHIEYSDKLGPACIARDKAGQVPTVRMNAFMGALSGVPSIVFVRLKGADMNIYSQLASLFSWAAP